MHFLGLNGKPRRIPSYPNGYSAWNDIMTLGSLLTVISVILFLYIVSNALLINKKYYLMPVSYSKFINSFILISLSYTLLVDVTLYALKLSLFIFISFFYPVIFYPTLLFTSYLV